MDPATEPNATINGASFTAALNALGTASNGRAFYSADPSAVVFASNAGSGYITVTQVSIARVGPIHALLFEDLPFYVAGIDTGYGIIPAAHAWTPPGGGLAKAAGGIGAVLTLGAVPTAVSNILVSMSAYYGSKPSWVCIRPGRHFALRLRG